ncbi:phosphatidylinositide phosphatase SAC2 [Schistocerca nitens]|uniref:phosphatidylinositide phosphatase SAC2 n=1 Tax=Schistocerca nitens TaxID=7011 RepID=UPI0021199DD3|nr:phosphatidylinositide phosphatase SAC2 [Schistocerca nitens]
MMSTYKVNDLSIELFRTDQYYIFMKGEYGLWWNRHTGVFQAKSGWDLSTADDPDCLGVFYGIIGKIELHSVVESRLILVKDYAIVGDLPGGKTVYKIKSIVFLQLGTSSENADLGLHPCKKHQNGMSVKKVGGAVGIFEMHQKAALAKTWGTMKSAANTIKTTTQQAAALATSQVKVGKRRDSKDKEKFERRILDELQRVFTDTDSFYFSLSTDLTNSLQRQANINVSNEKNTLSFWKTVDDRFFWNKHMLSDILALGTPLADLWVIPVIQGFIQIEHCSVELGSDSGTSVGSERRCETFTLCLISRRSRFRAGTRYKRRGVDENGKCANYVETEQIISYHHHQVSFVQVRGSVPVFWSQPGYKYRPPPQLDKGEAETQSAFEKHFSEEVSVYGPVCIINLVEQYGKEKIIWDAYTNHILLLNNPQLTYVTFDFHEYCRGMRFENVSILIENIVDVIKDMSYCWRDREGLICSQKGVFRVNCIDCLDRTNVVQTAIAKAVMEIQFTKLGLIAPEGRIPSNIRNTFQLLWANNGDIISKQYAGTNALKGDYTRTGERKFTGMMKDGMNSANRYYLSRFKDAYRQATIDMMLGNIVSDDVFSQEKAVDEEDVALTAEHVKLLIEDCKKMLISDSEIILGAWGLIDADPVSGDPTETEMDSILILTRDSYYVADYDDQLDRVMKYQRVLLEDIHMIECGPVEQQSVPLFKHTARTSHYCLRIHYVVANSPGYFHMFRSTNLRFFNNMAVGIRTDEEMIESLKAICEAFMVAVEVANLPPIPYIQGKLERKKSKVLSTNSRGHTSGIYLDVCQIPHMTRNVSETQLLALKNVGTRALTNMTMQFNKLNKIGHSFNTKKAKSIVSDETQLKEMSGVQGRGEMHVSYSKVSSDEEGDDAITYAPGHQEPVMPINHSHISFSKIKVKPVDSYLPSVGIIMSTRVSENMCTRNTERIAILNQTDELFPLAAPHIDSVSLSQVVQNVSIRRHILTHSRTDLSLDVSSLHSANVTSKNSSLTPSPLRPGSTTPEITIENTAVSSTTLNRQEPQKFDGLEFTCPEKSGENANEMQKGERKLSTGAKLTPPNTLPLTRKLSHSSGEVDGGQITKTKEFTKQKNENINQRSSNIKFGDSDRHLIGSLRCSSERELCFNITSSQSENALRSIRSGFTNAITSPVAVTKDLVLSPFSKIAKGMQNLGANLDPRKLKGPATGVSGMGRHTVMEQHCEEIQRLQEKWKSCRTRLIAL